MINRQSMLYKYFKIFILILVIPIVSINFIINHTFKDILTRNASNNLRQAILQTSKKIDNDIKRVSLAAGTLYNDNVTIDLVNEWYYAEDNTKKFTYAKKIDYNLNYLFNFNNEVESIIFFFKDGTCYTYKNFPQLKNFEIREMEWYDQVLRVPGKISILELPSDFFKTSQNKYILSAAIAPYRYKTNNAIEAIYVGFRIEIPDTYYNQFTSEQEDNMFILGSNNQVLVAKDKALVGKALREIGIKESNIFESKDLILSTVDNKKMLIAVQPIEKVEWKLLGLIDYKYITGDIDKVNRYITLIFSALLLLFTAYSVFYLKDILMPIKKMISKMGQVEKGDFTTHINLNQNTEITNLSNAFNKMVFEINNLIKERDAKEREKNKAEIEVLQSQINPHFLSNTLNAIRFMAMIAKAENISRMIEMLIRLLHASFGKKGKHIKIAEELENLESYIYIMKIRYADQFEIKFDIEEEIKEYYILRLLLQPIIENAILHGSSHTEKKGEIKIIGTLDTGCVLFEIYDTGMGMTEAEIHRILTEECKNEKGFTSIGIRNVNRRVQLNNGEQYGITIESEVGEYTKVKIRLPILKAVGGIEDV